MSVSPHKSTWRKLFPTSQNLVSNLSFEHRFYDYFFQKTKIYPCSTDQYPYFSKRFIFIPKVDHFINTLVPIEKNTVYNALKRQEKLEENIGWIFCCCPDIYVRTIQFKDIIKYRL